MTALDLITSSLRLIGALAASENPTTSEAQDGLAALNALLDSWAAERLFIHTVEEVLTPLVVGQASYTLGPGGQINRDPRPVWISAGSLVDTTQTTPVEYPLEGPLTVQQWRRVTVKTLASDLPVAFYVDGGVPLRTLTLWPVPNRAGVSLKLYLPAPLIQVPSLTTTLTLPTGYARALRFALAVELAPEFGVPVPPRVEAVAREATAIVKRINQEDWALESDPLLVGGVATYDWRRE